MDAFFLTSRLTRLYGEMVSSKMYLSSVPNLMQMRGGACTYRSITSPERMANSGFLRREPGIAPRKIVIEFGRHVADLHAKQLSSSSCFRECQLVRFGSMAPWEGCPMQHWGSRDARCGSRPLG